MHDIKQLTYKKLRNWLSLLAGVSCAVILIILFAIQIDASIFNVVMTSVLSILTFISSFVAIYWQSRDDFYGRYWLFFALILGLVNSFLAGLIGRLIFAVVSDFGIQIEPKLALIFIAAIFSVTMVFISCRAVYKLNQKRLLIYIAATFLIGLSTSVVVTHIYDWWISSICALGMPSHPNADIYNLTLV